MRAVALVLVGSVALAACDSATLGPEAAPALVVSALLGAGEPFPPIRITRTVGIGEVYDEERAGVAGATIRVTREGGAPVLYVPGAQPGLYEPATLGLVEPGATYRLEVAAPGAGPISATTTVPRAFEVLAAPPDTVRYQQPVTGPVLRISINPAAERQAVYVATTRALAPDSFDPVTVDGQRRFRSAGLDGSFLPVPLLRRFLGCEPDGARLLCRNDPSENTGGTSPIINERSYLLPGDGTAVVNVPWIGFGFYGPNQISLVSLDPAMQAFVESQALQAGGGTLSPGEIPNVTTNVSGGLGLFGSFARIVVETTILP